METFYENKMLHRTANNEVHVISCHKNSLLFTLNMPSKIVAEYILFLFFLFFIIFRENDYILCESSA